MSHGLELFKNGGAAFFSAREPAWHRLGTVTAGALTADEALIAAKLGGWCVEKRPIMTTSPAGMAVPVMGKFATVRRAPDPDGPEHDALGVVGNDYEVIQNEDAFGFLNGLMENGEALFESAGSLRGGSKVFVTMRVPDRMRIADGEGMDLYVGISNTHDGSEGLMAFPTPIRVVCQNTLSLALKGNKGIHRVRHDARARAKMTEAREIIRLTVAEGEKVKDAAKAMLRVKVTPEAFDAVVAQQFVPLAPDAKPPVVKRAREHRDALHFLFTVAHTQEFGRGTAWGAYNAIAEWAEWVRPSNPTDPAAAKSALEGRTAEIRHKAFKVFAPPEVRSAA